MRVLRFAPGERLAPYLRLFEAVEASETVERTLLPETGLIVGFRYAGSATLVEGQATRSVPDVSITGVRTAPRRMRTPAGGGILLAKFRAGEASPFFRTPLHALFGLTCRLDDLAPRGEVERTAERIAGAKSHAERQAVFEQFLLARFRPGPPDGLVAAALGSIAAGAGAVRIGAIARDLGVSQDALEKRFRRAVGATPKQLASIVRLRRAFGAIRPGASLTELSVEAGYYDQSHFIREVRSMTGSSPRRLLQAADFC